MRKGEIIFKELENIDDKYLEECFEYMNKNKKKNRYKGIAVAILAMLIILPNISPAFAKTLAEIPLLGKLFEVVTIIEIQENDKGSDVSVSVPKIKNETEDTSIDRVNNMTEEYIQTLINKFHEDVNGSIGSLDVDYKVVTNNDTWFTIVIESTEVQASGYRCRRYYNIDKVSGEYKILSDLFNDFSIKKDLINKNIVEQMNVKMEDEDYVYFIKEIDGSGFESIKENQNYYYNEDNELVISFDEYEVAPGYMGIVEFVIPQDILK